MAEIMDLDIIPEVKKKDKKKIFLALAVVAAAAGLYAFYKNRNSGDGAVSYVASGYGGYPTVPGGGSGSGGGGDDISDISSYYEGIIAENEKFYESTMTDITSQYDTYIDSITDQYEGELAESEQLLSKTQGELTYAQTLAEMQKNSDMWWYGTTEEKEALVQRNEELGAAIGATKVDGAWYDASGNRLFTNAHESAAQRLNSGATTVDTGIDYQAVVNNLLASGHTGTSKEVTDAVVKRAEKIVSTGATEYATTYDKNVDYSLAIKQAQESGADQSVIDTLTAQRNAKIKGENMTEYM